MERYSSDFNSPSGEEGDNTLVGVNSWDAHENLQPGQVQEAINMDFTSGDAVTRGGFVCLPSLGVEPFYPAATWTIRASAANYSWNSVCFGNNRFVCVGNSGGTDNVMTSPDGVTWTLGTGVAGSWLDVRYDNGLFVAVGNSGANRIMTSVDGVTWTARTAPELNTWTSVTYGGGLYVAVSQDGTNRVMTSPDGVTWTSGSASAVKSWNAVIYGDGLFVAVAGEVGTASVMTSPDGITWTTGTSVSGSWVDIAYGRGTYVAVGLSGVVMTSTDGTTWTSRSAAEANNWAGVSYGDGLFVATSLNGSSRVMTSPNGVNWVSRSAAAANSWTSVDFGNHLFVAVSFDGTGNRVMTSPSESVYASAIYSDPNDAGSQWIMLAGASQVGFYAFGRASRSVSYASGLTVSEQATIVQANNQVFIFRGADAAPLRWSGNWGDEFELATGTIPSTNQALYAQNRLWCIDGKDTIRASDVLDFTVFNALENSVNIGIGDSTFLVTLYPFGNSTILVFKNRSIIALTGIEGALSDIVASEVTRQVGAVGINSVVSVGPDVVYMSDRNINLITLTSTNNALQHKILPLSRNIQKIFNRVNWEYGYKVSMGFHDNKLFVALPLDNATTCNAVVVYNFVTENWFGEWNFDESLGMAIQNFVVANYLGLQRLHAVTEDGRIFVVGDGQNDISGTTVAEISTSLTSRAYSMGNQNHTPRRLYLDLATNRPKFSVTAYSEGVSEYTEELTDQTFSRSDSWIFNDSTYDLTNANDDYNRAGRKDYSAGTGSGGIESGTGFLPEAEQEYRLPIMTRRNGRLSWLKVENTTGLIRIMTVGFEARAGNRGNYIQVL